VSSALTVRNAAFCIYGFYVIIVVNLDCFPKEKQSTGISMEIYFILFEGKLSFK